MSFKKDDSFCVPLWINGTTLRPEDSPTYDVTTPPSQSLTWKACAATPTTINEAIQSASQAFTSWSKTPLSERLSILSKAADILELKGDEVQYYFEKEISGTEAWSSFNLNFCVGSLRSIGDVLGDTLRPEVIKGKDGMKGTIARVPHGVVGAVSTWNAPLILGLRACLTPIAAGNTVVMLAAPLAPMTHYFIGLILHAAGLPAGVLNVLPAPPAPKDAAEVVETLLKHPRIRCLNFTGSTTVGRKVHEVAGRYGKPVIMELGGKCVALALKNADTDKLAQELVVGAYLNSGQICMSTELALIPSRLVPTLIEKLISTIPKILPHPRLPIITHHSKQKVLKLITDAVQRGAIIHSASISSDDQYSQLDFLKELAEDTNSSLPPLFLTKVTQEMEIYNTESFGPVFCILEYEDDNVDKAVKMANDLEVGLSVSIFSADEDEAMNIAGEIDSGAVHINHMTVYDNPAFPHGGVKASGFGRFGGKWGIEEFTYIKTITAAI
ncbi:hypothetical protein TWF569_009116 [Orbilia oligospora]|uniref:Aldehyde dehydrogenase domain-containing protein n=1 Tax=Orbilia oligospora TaxID=2813651 RepID=A0A7C8NQR3_ORBOL|nr:hypothetical protein TWF706_005327 [Orbilia oligospora]KAF3122309.1 hypothetical protein TWF594_002841 [Orbilia oligospora]KAF3130048.1 hypothetical protein TWF703_008387 [Orbilia oligospora]KAF3137663.1 hypothetical protein TWF569_009116 [Orbilia oligospora]